MDHQKVMCVFTLKAYIRDDRPEQTRPYPYIFARLYVDTHFEFVLNFLFLLIFVLLNFQANLLSMFQIVNLK